MKPLMMISLLMLSPLAAKASTECFGETYKGAVVSVEVQTVGTMGYVQGGTVRIKDENGKNYSYSIKHEDIPQFYERAEGRLGEKGMVLMESYVNTEAPVSIRYIGTNFDEPAKALRTPSRKKEAGNEMRVWKGPGFQPDQQYQFTDVVCQVILDV